MTCGSADCIVATHKLRALQLGVTRPRDGFAASAFPLQAGAFGGTKTIYRGIHAMRANRLYFPSLVPFFFVFLVILVPNFAWAVNFQPVSPDELKMTGEPKAPGAPAIILFREVDRDDRGQTAHEDVHFRIKILTDEGRKYADIEIPFWKEQGGIFNLHARTIKPDGSIVNFNGKARFYLNWSR